MNGSRINEWWHFTYILKNWLYVNGQMKILGVSVSKGFVAVKSQRIDAFELWCWRRLSRVPWTTRRSNQSILKSLIVIGRTDAETETPVLWPPDVKN